MASPPPAANRAEQGRRVAAILEGAWRTSPPPLRFSPEELIDAAPLLLKTGGAALAWGRIRHTELSSSPWAGTFRDVYRLNTLNDALLGERIGTAVTAIRSAGVEPILAKGWAAARLYPEPGLRPYGDIDLYVGPEQHAPAWEALMSLPRPPVGIDLHQGFSDLDDRRPDQLLARARPAAAQGVRVFGPEDHLRLFCLHLLRHGASRPVWLCDVAAAVESRPREFDWDYFMHGDQRRADACACVLGLAARVLGARLEGTPVAKRADRLPSWLIPAVLREWGSASDLRLPMAVSLRRPRGALTEARRHWPNPIEGTIGVLGPFNELPRLPFQLAFTLVRTGRFALSLPRLLWPRHLDSRLSAASLPGPRAGGRS